MSCMLQGARVRIGDKPSYAVDFAPVGSPEEAVAQFVDYFRLEGVCPVQMDADGPGSLRAEYAGDRSGAPWPGTPAPWKTPTPCVAEAVVVRLEPVWLKPPANVDHHPV